MLPHDLTILVDTREKRPLQFPAVLEFSSTDPPSRPATSTIRIHTEHRKLDSADYRVLGYESCGGVERKLDLTELHKNLCTSDSKRFRASMQRLSESCEHPLLMVESSPYDLSKPPRIRGGPSINPVVIRDRLMDVCLDYGVELWVLPGASARNRNLIGEWVAAYLLRSIRNVHKNDA